MHLANHKSLDHYFKEKTFLINQRLNELVPEKEGAHSDLFRAARYSLLSPGKKIRPILALATCECLGGNLDLALTPACTLELVHTYSLIHDDLPCIDNDDFRRGKPSLHKAFPESHAVLAGDFLLTHAFGILARAPGLDPSKKIELIDVLEEQIGGNGMIAGQIIDIQSEKKELSLPELENMHLKKTGALIDASIDFGALIADADENTRSLLRSFSCDIGLAFQVVDDILDVTSSETKHGKIVASDIINEKTTYITLLGLSRSKSVANDLLNSALDKLKSIPNDTFLLSEIAKFIINRSL